MTEARTKECDNTSVGVIVRNAAGLYALLERKKFPIGFAPPAGHIDTHGGSEAAAIEEVAEEIGVQLPIDGLRKVIENRLVNNRCRRPGGDFHIWDVYEAEVDDAEIEPSTDETRGARWYTQEEVQELADRTRLHIAGAIPDDEWAARPGMELVWVGFMEELGHIR